MASPGKGAIFVFTPEGGEPERIAMPDPMTTNICFGGPDLKTAFVTLAATGSIAMLDWDVPGLKLAY